MLEGNSQKIQDIGTQAREISQAMSERVDLVEKRVMSIQSILKAEAYKAADYRSAELKKEILNEVDQKIIALETRIIV